jgi:tripartite-type tricarboxylate transporter receptor subunit TctC
MKFRAWIDALVVAGLMAGAAPALAQTGGDTVRILVGFPPGGAPDTVARVFGEQLRAITGATVVVENRTGASGKIAADHLLASPADGYTVSLMPSSVLVLIPQIVGSATYDPIRDFVTLGSLVEHGLGIAAGPGTPATSWAGYKDWARANPQKSSYATPGLGTPQHFLGAQLQATMGVPAMHVPYKGGAAALNDVIGGQVPLLITTEQLLVPYQADGRLRTLFVTSARRNPRLPTVPTAIEVGLPQLEYTDWFGLFAKAGLPPAKVAEWRANVVKVVTSPAYREAIEKMGYAVPAQQPGDFAQVLTTARSAWAERVKLSGFKAED